MALPDPAPLRWPTTRGGSGGHAFPQKVISYPEFVALQRANGELAETSIGVASPGISTIIRPLQSRGTVENSVGDGFDWLGAAQTVADAIFGGGDGLDGGDNALARNFGGGASGDSTALGDAQPFRYRAGSPGEFGDDIETAWLPSRGGPPSDWLENSSGKQQWRLYDGNGDAAVDIDFGHDHGFGIPHAHNWDDGVRDQGNAVSLLPY